MRVLIVIFISLNSAIGLFAQMSSAKWRVTEVEGDSLLSREDYPHALVKYNQAMDVSKLKDTESKRLLYKRAICYYSLQDFQKALDDLNAFIPYYPSFPRAKFLRVLVNGELGNTQAQFDDIHELELLEPGSPDILSLKVNIYLEAEQYDSAKVELLRLQRINDDEETETQLGFVYYNLEDADSAFVHFDRAITLNENYAPAYVYMSSLCLEQEAYAMTLMYVDRGLLLDPQSKQLLFYKGIALAESEKLEAGCSILAKLFYEGFDQAGDYLKQHCYGID